MSELLEYIINDILNLDLSGVEIKLQKDGLTNLNYVITQGNNRYVIRISNDNSHCLGIDRNAEIKAMSVVDELGIGAKLLYHSIEKGYMVTEYIEGDKWTDEETKKPENMIRIAKLMKMVHGNNISYEFSPYRDIEHRISFAREHYLELPDNIEELLVILQEIEKTRNSNGSKITGLCHNDPFSNNYIDSETLRLIDWEYAGMGDIYFDLACICMAYSEDERDNFLTAYFGEYDDEKIKSINQMTYVGYFWNAMWAVVQSRSENAEHDYKGIANYLFGRLSYINLM